MNCVKWVCERTWSDDLRDEMISGSVGSGSRNYDQGFRMHAEMAMGDVTTVNRYEKGGTIGSGTSRIVFKAIDKLTNRTVVVTMIRTGEYKESVNVTLLREIRLLKELHNPNVIELVDMYQHKRNLYLVFEYMESDLEAVIYDRNTFQSPADYKSYI